MDYEHLRENLQFPANLFRFTKSRSSCSDVFCKESVLKIFAKFTGKHLCQGLFFDKAAGLLATEEFETAFKSLKRNKAAGIDTINSNIVLDTYDEIKDI